jgi:hypothetical protein
MMQIFRVAEGKSLEDIKPIPVSVFMKRIRGISFPRYSLPVEETDEGGVVSDDELCDD